MGKAVTDITRYAFMDDLAKPGSLEPTFGNDGTKMLTPGYWNKE